VNLLGLRPPSLLVLVGGLAVGLVLSFGLMQYAPGPPWWRRRPAGFQTDIYLAHDLFTLALASHFRARLGSHPRCDDGSRRRVGSLVSDSAT